MYGRPAGRPLTETRDYAAHPKKGNSAAGWPKSCSTPPCRPSGGRHRTCLGLLRPARRRAIQPWRPPAALAAKTARVLGDPDQPHTYTYIPDIGEGLAVLGEHPDAPRQVWHLPNDPDTRTTRELCQLVFQQAGTSPARVRQVPPLFLRLAALTNPTVRELLEMQYQFAEPFIVDSSKINHALHVQATPIEEALAATLATYHPQPAEGPHALHLPRPSRA